MAQSSNPRRFYIDHADDQTVVRTVPVRYAPPVETAPESVATHQVPASAVRPNAARTIAEKARRAPQSMSRLVKTRRHNGSQS
jgi:hypothetical protein